MQNYIKDYFTQGRPVVSFEVFPPKKDADIAQIYGALGQMSALGPDFISVTYGAGGGGNSGNTVEIAAAIQQSHHVCSLAHLTCVGADKDSIRQLIAQLKAKEIRNVLALRGDVPAGLQLQDGYRYAEDLIRALRASGDFCIGAACYPEGHIECDDLSFDTECLRRKQDAGAAFLITQLFFDNEHFYRFMERARRGGVTIPISAGVMPILSQKQIARMIFTCGASLPAGIIRLLHKYADKPDDLRRAGIEYMANQAEQLLAHGADGVHLYTMNKPDIAAYCMTRIGKAHHAV